MRLRLGQKLMLGFVPVLAILAALGLFTYRELDYLHEISDLLEQTQQRSNDVLALSLQVKDLQAIPLHNLGHEDERYLTEFQAKWEEVSQTWDGLAASPVDAQEEGTWRTGRASLTRLVEAGQMAFMEAEHGGAHEIMEHLDAAGAEVESAMLRLRDVAESNETILRTKVEGVQWRVKFTLMAALLSAGLLGIGISLVTARHISRPLVRFAANARRLAEGDLRVEKLAVSGRDELGDMASSYNRMVMEWQQLLLRVTESTDAVAGAAQHVKNRVTRFAEGTSRVHEGLLQVTADSARQEEAVTRADTEVAQQRSAIAQITSSATELDRHGRRLADAAEQMTAAVEGVSDRASMVAEAATEASAVAADGAQVVNRTIHHMNQIQRTVTDAAEQVKGLSDQSHRIGAIIEAISDIAEQTNLLALNAAIEAARAGEHGKGFAVVAGEVRRLAGRAAKSADEVAALVGSIQQGTASVVRTIDEGMSAVGEGAVLAEQTAKSLMAIHQGVDRTRRDTHAIREAVTTLSTLSRLVAESVLSVASAAEQNSASAQQMQTSADQVSSAMTVVTAASARNRHATASVGESAESMRIVTAEIEVAASELSRTAEQLRSQVARFVL